MADVTGPISTLPGSVHAVPKGAKCDFHGDRIAVVRWQGETDSFGSEMYDLCRECADSWRRQRRERDTSGRCDWCKKDAPKRRDRRCSDEGFYGPVYQVCDGCCERQDKALAEEMREWSGRNGWWD